jgi:hypothetical protein
LFIPLQFFIKKILSDALFGYVNYAEGPAHGCSAVDVCALGCWGKGKANFKTGLD